MGVLGATTLALSPRQAHHRDGRSNTKEANVTRSEANRVIAAHSAGSFDGKYSDYVQACAVIWESEQAAAPPKRKRTGDTAQHIYIHLPVADQGGDRIGNCESHNGVYTRERLA
jgi:hypothetical protein